MKIDTSTIQGFGEMTPEQKLDALLAYELDTSRMVDKGLFDKTASELADAKRQIKAGLSADEAARAEANERFAELEAKYSELLRAKTVADNMAKYLALGYPEKLAAETAEALFNGDMDKVFANQQIVDKEREKKLRDELLKAAPFPAGGSGTETERPDIALGKKIGKARAGKSAGAETLFK